MTENIAERIQQLIKERNETATHVLTQLKLSPNALSEWKRGKAKPSSDAVIKIAEYFNVSTDYLLSGKIINTDLRKEEQSLLLLYRQLSETGKEKVLSYAEGYLAASHK